MYNMLLNKHYSSTGCSGSIFGIFCLHLGAFQCGNNTKDTGFSGQFFLSLSSSQYLRKKWSQSKHNHASNIFTKRCVLPISALVYFFIELFMLISERMFILYTFKKLSSSFCCCPFEKWWAGGNLSRTEHRQMPHNFKGAQKQREDQHCLESPADLLLWSPHKVRHACMSVILGCLKWSLTDGK